nr:uncharacterized protein LOC125643376 isoform X2 [Caretta caretta]
MATRVRDRAACCGDMAERVSPRGLVRSVSQRLKYYIDVQRKEDSFDLSGASRNEAESPSFYMHPGSIAEQKCDQCLKHNFTDCKFEASLRVYTGNSEECERKLQSSPERQQEMKIIKKKNWHKIKKLHSFPSRLSQFPPPPYTSQEEVMRLISSASKLIVAATCEISSEEIKKPDCALPQKRKEAKNIQRLDHYCKQHTPPLVISPDPHEYDTKSTGETNKLEESNADFIQEDSRNDYRKSGVHHSQNNTCNSLHQRTQSNQRQKKKKDLCELATGKITKSHKICFQGPLQFSRNTEQKCKCVNLNSCNITSEYGIQTIASESKSLETMTSPRE